MVQPQVTIFVKNPGNTSGQSSYFDFSLSDNSFLSSLGSTVDGWCLDSQTDIRRDRTYTATIYSSYELDSLVSVFPNVQNQNNLDLVNWIINQNFTANPQYNYGEVQAAIWTLLGDGNVYNPNGADLTASGALVQSDIDAIVAQAQANGENFVPDNSEKIAVILDPVNSDGQRQQPVIIEVQAAKLGDFVWEDTDADGIQDAGENGIAGVTVNLTRDKNNDGDVNDAGEILATTTTDNTGFYQFKGLTPSLEYQVQFVQPNGFNAVSPRQQGGNAANDSDGLLSDKIILSAGEFNQTIDSGFFKLVPKASLGDKVFVDNNVNGIQDAGDVGLGGVTVELLDANGNVIDSTTTDAAGMYGFNNLDAGDYKVRFTAPAGYNFATPNAGNDDTVDSDAGANGVTQTVTLAPGDNNTTLDAGLVLKKAAIDIEKFVRGKYVVETGSGGGEGLTPGFWKTHSEYGPAPETGWDETGLDPDDSFESVFGVNIPNSNPNLLQALNTEGGGVEALTRHATAALLNASNPYVDYLYTKAQVISMTQSAFASGNYDATKNMFESQNELGADLSTPKTSGNTVIETPDEDADNPPGIVIPVGGEAIFTYVVTNPGEVALSNIQVTDDRIPTVTFIGGDTDGDNLLDPDETWKYTSKETVQPGSYQNIGTVVGTNPASGGTVTDNDAANYTTSSLTSSIGDRVWEDTNANGIQDAGEQGIAGVTVQLKNSNGTIVQTKTTDTNGNYLFDVAPGSYSVGFVKPNGFVASPKDQGSNDAVDSDIDPTTLMTANVNIVTGQQNLTLDAGFVPIKPASLGDYVFADCDNDGVQDTNEPGVAGVTVKLLNASGATIATTTTNNNGKYLFDNLNPGSYSVQFVNPIGTTFTAKDQGGNDNLDSDADPNTGKTGQIVLESGENDLSVDAGLKFAKICADFNFNGNTPLSGTFGNIRNFNSNGISVNASAFSRDRANGSWATAYLGSYGGGLGVTDSSEGNGSGNTHTVDNVGGRDNYVLFEFDTSVILDKTFLGYVVNDSDLQVWIGNFNNPFNNHLNLNDTVLNGMGFTELNKTNLTGTRTADLNAGEFVGNTIVIAADTTDSSPEDFFKIQNLSVCTPGCPPTSTPKASLGDRVWEDKNANGIQDAGENGIAGVTVKLLNNAGQEISSTVTNSNGNYNFNNLNPGDYQVQFVSPANYFFSPQDKGGNDTLDSDANPSNGKTITTNLVAGENDTSWDAGLYRKASIGDCVWHDANKNGILDAGESGFAGVTVKLLNAAGTQVGMTTTNANGGYSFTNLDPGAYSVQFVAPTGYAFSPANQGTDDTKDSDANTTTGVSQQITLTSGEFNKTVDAGLYKVNVPCTPISFCFSGNTALDGMDGNTYTFTKNGLSVKVSGFSRDKANGSWSKAYVGAYGSGLGVTNSAENGYDNSHRVDNVGSRNDFLVFQFSAPVKVDDAYLNSVYQDSDATAWVGNTSTPFSNNLDLNDSVLGSLTREESWGGSSSRWADLNAGGIAGNTFVIAASLADTSPEDWFKVNHLDVCFCP